MPVSLFTAGIEPEDPDTPIWRFMEFWKFQGLIRCGNKHLAEYPRRNLMVNISTRRECHVHEKEVRATR